MKIKNLETTYNDFRFCVWDSEMVVYNDFPKRKFYNLIEEKEIKDYKIFEELNQKFLSIQI